MPSADTERLAFGMGEVDRLSCAYSGGDGNALGQALVRCEQLAREFPQEYRVMCRLGALQEDAAGDPEMAWRTFRQALSLASEQDLQNGWPEENLSFHMAISSSALFGERTVPCSMLIYLISYILTGSIQSLAVLQRMLEPSCQEVWEAIQELLRKTGHDLSYLEGRRPTENSSENG